MDYLESTELLQFIKSSEKTSFIAAIDSCECIFELFLYFDQNICSTVGPMALFWNSFIEMAQILLDYIKLFRTGDWSLHWQTSEQMLVWSFACDQVNYLPQFSYNWATQQQLHLTHWAIWPSDRTHDQQRAKGIWRNNWNRYIRWSSSKMDIVKVYYCWTFGKLQRKCQSYNKKKSS